MDIFSITYSSENIDRNMYDKFIISIGREVRLGWYLYASVKDLVLHPTLNLSPERYPHLNILLVKKKLLMIRGEKKISRSTKTLNVIETFHSINLFN